MQLNADLTGGVPADHRDPNHPHNGDVECQTGYARPLPKRKFNKRTIFIVALTTLFLVALGTGVGLGYYFGRRQSNDANFPPPVVTANVSITTHIVYVTPRPSPNFTQPVCHVVGMYPSEEICTQECASTGSHCTEKEGGHFWKCLQCAEESPGSGRATSTSTFTSAAVAVSTAQVRECVNGDVIYSTMDKCRDNCPGDESHPLANCDSLDESTFLCRKCRPRAVNTPSPTLEPAASTPAPSPTPELQPAKPEEKQEDRPVEEPEGAGTGCMISGHFFTKEECTGHCKPLPGKEKFGCDTQRGVWKCYQCAA